jgi:hypothetical protein
LVNHNSTECNKAAHALAAVGRECEEGTNPILDIIPNCIMNIVADYISNKELKVWVKKKFEKMRVCAQNFST